MATKIKVHDKVLAHLSRGLYRSPASAIRELVSNAWDANATVVQINTNYPNFLRLTIQDNGDGFTKDEFREIMEGGIGNSEKRGSHSKGLRYGRSIIGRLGIGMLGIAQLTGSFTVVSKTGKDKGFRAKVRLYDLLKEKMDEDDPTIITIKKIIDLGEFDFEDFDPDTEQQGTKIIADDIHPTFAQSFQQSLKFPDFKPPPLEWEGCLDVVSKVHSLQQLGDYWRLLWELSASCPIPYLSPRSLPDGLIKDDQERLLRSKFSLVVDNRKVFKPVNLHGNKAGYTWNKIAQENKKIYGKDLSFHGYIAVQEGAQLHPDELRGVLIRIKDVAIGYYDPSLLDYRTNEGPRSRWLTGEIFVDKGLEDALNVDRDSFNRVHPEFKTIQEHIHGVLKLVFSDVWKNIDVRSKEKSKQKEKARRHQLGHVIAEAMESKVLVKTAPATDEDSSEVVIEESSSHTAITLPSQESIKTKKSNKQLAASILALFEVAMLEKTGEKRRERFSELLLSLLAKW